MIAEKSVAATLHIAKGENHTSFWGKLHVVKYVAQLLKVALHESISTAAIHDFDIRYFKENDE